MAVNAAKDDAGMRRDKRTFSAGAVHVLPRAALLPASLLFLVALTGIERVSSQFSSVQLGLSLSFYVELVRKRWRKGATGARRVSAVLARGPESRSRIMPGRAGLVSS